MLIKDAKNCTVRMFIECRYENNLSVLGEGTPQELAEAWNNIYATFFELCDTDMPDLPLMTAIHNTQIRIMAMEAAIIVQRKCIEMIGRAYTEDFPRFERYNHQLTYDGDNEAFLKQLERIESKEKKFVGRLAEDKKNLENLRIAEGQDETKSDSRIHFISMLNKLSQDQGYPINWDTTTVEMLAVLIGDRSKAARTAQAN